MTGPCTSSGLVAASAVVSARTGRLRGLTVLADATNAATVIIYDNATAASGTILAKWIVKATDTAGSPQLPDHGIVCNNGLYAAISGTGAACIVLFDVS